VNYSAHYDRLIARARIRVLTGYRERHHVIPRCMGGGNEEANLVELTPEEHYVAHQLLVKMYPARARLVYAVNIMSKRCTGNKAYGWIRRRLALVQSAANRGKPKPPRSIEHRANLAKAMRGKRHSAFTRAKISSIQIGRTLLPEHREKISLGMLGKQNCLGRKLSKSHRENIKATHQLPETRARISASRRGQPAWNKGIPMSMEQREKLSAVHRARHQLSRENQE